MLYPYHAGPDPKFTLPMSSDCHHHENGCHSMGRRASIQLANFFGRSGPKHSRTLSLFDPLICEGSHMSLNADLNDSEPSHENSPIASTTALPKGRLLRKISQKPLRYIKSMSTTLPIQLNSYKSTDDIKYFNQQSQSPTSSTRKFFWSFDRSGSDLDSKTTNKQPSKEQFRYSPLSGSSKFRIVGRGGSGSQSRHVSPSDPPPVLGSYVSQQRQPPESGFHRPAGRGGLGPLSTKPLKPPTTIFDLLRGYSKRSQAQQQSGERCKPREAQLLPTNCHSSQITNDSFSISNAVLSSRASNTSMATTTLEELDPTISRNTDLDDIEDTNSHIAEATCPTPDEHRQRSLNKLARTLGALPSPRISIVTNMGDKFIGPRSSHHNCDSFTLTDDLHQFKSADDSKSWDELDPRSSFESDTHSPIVFAPPTPSEGIKLVTSTNEEHNSDSYSLMESPPSSSTTHFYVSNHFTSHSTNDLPADPTWLSNVLTVPSGTHNDEVTGTASSKPQHQWTGEWNEDIQDVIQGLRRL